MFEPSLNLYKPLANRTGYTNLPSLLRSTSSLLASVISISSASTKAKYFEAKSPGSKLTGNFCVKPAPSESVLATIIPSSTPSSKKAYLTAFSFGLKIKQLRTDKNLSLFDLSKLSGLSKSYLNATEKGKKYPKTTKIAILSNVLEVDYDNMVSLKLDKNLAPLGEILQSKILKEIPLNLFGIKETDLIDIIANAPAKVSAFITTLIEIAQNYNLSRENFYLAALRSYQEAHNNYFEDIEIKAE